MGLNISKIPRTGAIKQANLTLDYISIKAFIKEGIRWSVDNEKYTHWLPLYFGKEDLKERTLHLGQKALSMIMANSTKRFKEEFVLEVFPKILITTIFIIMDEKRHTSIRVIRMMTHIHALFLIFMQKFPKLYDVVENHLQEFIKDESKRLKDVTSNLGALLVKLFVSPKTKFQDISQLYISEQLDRQVRFDPGAVGGMKSKIYYYYLI